MGVAPPLRREPSAKLEHNNIIPSFVRWEAEKLRLGRFVAPRFGFSMHCASRLLGLWRWLNAFSSELCSWFYKCGAHDCRILFQLCLEDFCVFEGGGHGPFS